MEQIHACVYDGQIYGRMAMTYMLLPCLTAYTQK